MEKRSICHVEFVAGDRKVLGGFFEKCFGWKTTEVPDMSNYSLLDFGQQGVGGGIQDPGKEHKKDRVLVYMTSPDLAADAKKIVAEGGSMIGEPAAVGTAGKLQLFKDPAGNTLGLWCPSAEPEKTAGVKRKAEEAEVSEPAAKKEKVEEVSIKAKFEEISDKVKNIQSWPTNQELLTLYSLYKQATDGDVTGSRPGFSKMRQRYKWDAWKALKGKTAEEAMKDYIEFAQGIIDSYGMDEQS